MSKKSIRASMTTGLKRNSITMKLLSTYAKLSGDDDWEYMDKQTKEHRLLLQHCVTKYLIKDYDEEDEQLVDLEEKKPRNMKG